MFIYCSEPKSYAPKINIYLNTVHLLDSEQ